MATVRKAVCILGAGPAGLGTAWALVRGGERDLIVVDRNERVGGLSRTERFDENRFDVGPHRFFTSNREVNRLWHELLGADFRTVRRLTRIYYQGKLFQYPVSAVDALPKLGLVAATQALGSYAYAALTRDADRASTFEEWVSAKFGDKLYETFFRTYTEKVWGIPCSEIGADWAAQRIKGLSLGAVLRNTLGLERRKPKTLADEFDYPTRGAGMMYERMAEQIAEAGGVVETGTTVTRLERDGERIVAVVAENPQGEPLRIEADAFVSSLPLSLLVGMIAPALPAPVRRAAAELYYRDHITVNLVVEGDDLFPEQWIYVHAPDVQMGRLANYNNFSRRMVRTPGTTALSVEYFLFRSDPLWSETDAALVDLSIRELGHMGLVPPAAVRQGWVVRETEAYPTYFLGYAEPLATLRSAMDGLVNLAPVGRGGMYKYNNMDHSLYTGLLTARNLLEPHRHPYDVWKVNIDAAYHEGAERS